MTPCHALLHVYMIGLGDCPQRVRKNPIECQNGLTTTTVACEKMRSNCKTSWLQDQKWRQIIAHQPHTLPSLHFDLPYPRGSCGAVRAVAQIPLSSVATFTRSFHRHVQYQRVRNPQAWLTIPILLEVEPSGNLSSIWNILCSSWD